MSRFNTLDRPAEYAQITSQDFSGASPWGSASVSGLNPFDTLNWNESSEGERVSPSFGIDETAETAQASESTLIGEEVATSGVADSLGALADPAAAAVGMIGMGVDVTEDQVASENANANYINAMTNGHGLGFSQLADQNLKGSIANIQSHQALSIGLTSLMGPFGTFISSMFAPQQANNTSYDVSTTGGNVINAQAAPNAETSSDITDSDGIATN